MRTIFILFLAVFFCFCSTAQKASFGLIKYSVPSGWQEQTRPHTVSYFGTASEPAVPLEINIYENQPAGLKPDSSFKMEWQRVHEDAGVKAGIPYARKRYNPAGIRLAVNIANPVEITSGNQTRYSQLAVFLISGQMQTVEFVTNNPKDYKLLRPFFDEFIDAVEPIEQQKEG